MSHAEVQRTYATIKTNRDLAELQYQIATNTDTMSRDDVQKNIVTLRTNVRTCQGNLTKANAAIDAITNNRQSLVAERDSKLAEIDTNIANTRAKIDDIATQSSQTKMQQDLAKDVQDSGVLRAPFAGVITHKSLDVGTIVAPGMSVFTIATDSTPIVRISLDNTLYHLAIDDTLPVSMLADGQTFTGTVSLVDTTIDPLLHKQHVEIILPQDTTIGAGISVYVSSKSNTTLPSIVIPTDAIVSRYDTP